MRLPLLVAFGLLSAGCAAPAATLGDVVDAAVTLPWGFTDCVFAVAFVPVAQENVAARLPDGFRALSFSELGLPPDPRGQANVGTELWTCAQGAGLNGTVESIAYASVFVAVAPPEGLASEDNLLHFVKWDVLIPDADRRAFLVARGVPAVDGDGAFSSFNVQGDGAAFDGAFNMNGSYALRGASVAPADASLRDFRFTEFTPTPHGMVMWNTTVHAPAASAGSGPVTMGGLMAEIAGATTAQAYFLAGTGEFVEASIWLPPMARVT